MEKSKSKVALIITIVLLILVIAGLICYIVLNSNNENELEEKPVAEETSKPEDIVNERDLTTEEIAEIDEYLRNGKLNFLASEYKEPKEANLYFQIIYGYNSDKDLKRIVTYVDTDEELTNIGMTKEEIQTLKDFTKLAKITKKDLNEYLSNNLGVFTEDLNLDFMYKYSDTYEAYYFYDPTDAFPINVVIISGKINQNGEYVLKYEGDYGYSWTLTLRKDGDNYKFVSNVNNLSDKIMNIENKEYDKRTEEYSEQLDCIMHYEGDTLYYAELVNKEDDNDKSVYYYEDNVCFACINNKGSVLEYYNEYFNVSKTILSLFR